MRHLITIDDVSADEISQIFTISTELKNKYECGIREPILAGRMLALLFEKQSLRTRVSFEAGICQLGGGSMKLGDDVGFGSRESIADFARVLSGMVDVIVARAKRHSTVEEIADYSACTVVNGLTDLAHPCQALADLFTLQERFGDLRGRKLAWVGDGNNVAMSLARGCSKLGMHLTVCTPVGYELDRGFVARLNSPELSETCDPREAVRDVVAVYTDVWASMGQESEREQRLREFADFQVNGDLMAAAPAESVFMHCLPARRGEEVTDEVIDGPQSVVVQQAINRMHAQKGILVWLLARGEGAALQPAATKRNEQEIAETAE